jgi:hypothetical protein
MQRTCSLFSASCDSRSVADIQSVSWFDPVILVWVCQFYVGELYCG